MSSFPCLVRKNIQHIVIPLDCLILDFCLDYNRKVSNHSRNKHTRRNKRVRQSFKVQAIYLEGEVVRLETSEKQHFLEDCDTNLLKEGLKVVSFVEDYLNNMPVAKSFKKLKGTGLLFNMETSPYVPRKEKTLK